MGPRPYCVNVVHQVPLQDAKKSKSKSPLPPPPKIKNKYMYNSKAWEKKKRKKREEKVMLISMILEAWDALISVSCHLKLLVTIKF